MTHFAGIYPPIPTPFDSDERIAYDKLEANLQRWLTLPLDGFVVSGSNGEAALLSWEERLALWRACGEVLHGKGKHLIIGTGAETTAQTILLTAHAAEMGAAAALVITPSFFRAAMSHEALVAHYRAVADAASIPVLLYNVPMFTGVDMAAQTIIELAEHPRIVGLKDSSANVAKLATVLAARPGFQVLVGSGSALLPFLHVGAVGGVMALANVAARPLRRLMSAFEAGDLAEARRLQLMLVDLNSALTARFGVPGLKYALEQRGFYGGPVRRPLRPLPVGDAAELDRLLATIEREL